jgi:hypothetical protein
MLTFIAYGELAGFDSAPGRRASEIFEALPPTTQAALPQLTAVPGGRRARHQTLTGSPVMSRATRRAASTDMSRPC